MSLFITIIVLATLIIIATLLQESDKRIDSEMKSSNEINKLDELLPQTQCGDCGYNGCRPYAEAIVNNMEAINRCLPGGMKTVQLLAEQTGRTALPLYKDTAKHETSRIAIIDESACIGCVKCIRACPVDAIIGAPKVMHSVINQYCTGCELCIAPCPVDCISMVETL